MKEMCDPDLRKLSSEVCCKIQDASNMEGNDSLRLLRIKCGLRKCTCSTLSPLQNFNLLLKVLFHNESVLDVSVGLSIINNYDYLGLEEHCNKVLERILMHTMNMGPTEEKNKFLIELWGCPGLKNFTTTSLEALIGNQSDFLEEDILHVLEGSVKKETEPLAPIGKKYERIVLWSSNSSKIFCAVTSIFNAFLLRTGNSYGHYKFCMRVVHQFVCNVKLKCVENGTDFVQLYPSEYHSLVSLLDIDPVCFPDSSVVLSSVTLSTVVELILASLTSNPVQTLCILTHFPAWLPYINR